jgi:hypothetical protein
MPEGLPLGPDNSLEGLRDRIQAWSKGQGFTLYIQDSSNATQVRGKRVMLACHRYGKARKLTANRNAVDMARPTQTTKKTDCKWAIWLDESTEGWMVSSIPKAAVEDKAMGLAITAVLPSTVHLLCIFHIWKNFWKHMERSQQDILATW